LTPYSSYATLKQIETLLMGERLIATLTLSEIEILRPDKSGLKMTEGIIEQSGWEKEVKNGRALTG
jgi:hypothetical protein